MTDEQVEDSLYGRTDAEAADRIASLECRLIACSWEEENERLRAKVIELEETIKGLEKGTDHTSAYLCMEGYLRKELAQVRFQYKKLEDENARIAAENARLKKIIDDSYALKKNDSQFNESKWKGENL